MGLGTKPLRNNTHSGPLVSSSELLLDRAHRPLFVGELDVEPQVSQGGPRRLLGRRVRRQRRPQERLGVGGQEVGAQLAGSAHHVADRVGGRGLEFNRRNQLGRADTIIGGGVDTRQGSERVSLPAWYHHHTSLFILGVSNSIESSKYSEEQSITQCRNLLRD